LSTNKKLIIWEGPGLCKFAERFQKQEHHTLMRIEENQDQSQQAKGVGHLSQTCWMIWNLHPLICSIQLFLLDVLGWMLDEGYHHLSPYFDFDDENLIANACVVENVNESAVFFFSCLAKHTSQVAWNTL